MEDSPAQQSQVNADDDSHRELADHSKLSDSKFSEASTNTLTEFHIGIDDTDSEKGGCTTYTATVLFQNLIERGFKPSDFPWLVRLNPNIPWKTRGNGALAVHFFVDEEQIENVQRLALETVERTTVASARGTDPAVAFLKGQVPRTLREYSTRALHDVLSVREARVVAAKVGAEVHALVGVRGIIGSLAAIGASLNSVKNTFEIIAYRTRENLGTPRHIDHESVKLMDAKHGNGTFNNLDPESGRVLVSPHGPDPVLLGIRGYRPQDVLSAFNQVQLGEKVERVVIFRTNQGTDAHLRKRRRAVDLEPHQSGALTGRVEDANPICSDCGGRCESMGRGQGLRCKKCGQRDEYASKIQVRQQRHLQSTIYVPPPRARRHLTMPDSKPRNISNEYLRVEDFQLRVEDFN